MVWNSDIYCLKSHYLSHIISLKMQTPRFNTKTKKHKHKNPNPVLLYDNIVDSAKKKYKEDRIKMFWEHKLEYTGE